MSGVVRLSLVRNRAVINFAKRFNTIDSDQPSNVVYEAPYSGITTRLKAVSISSASVSAIAIPLLLHFYSGDIPQIGQYALCGTTMFAACGSTIAVNFCFAPYVHTLEKIPVRKCHAKVESAEQADCKPGQHHLIKATWRNFLLMKQETVFDPALDVTEYKGIRPFCNFVAKGIPFFIHMEILMDDELRKQLVGEKEAKRYNMPNKDMRKNDEDELF
jgi:hypothetical protein